jgi:Zn-dependent protease
VPGAGVRWISISSVHPEAAGIIPRGGPAIAILVAGIFVAVVGAIVAMEKQGRPFVWAVIGFVVTIVIASAALAVI